MINGNENPFIVVNFKDYDEAIGENALKLAQIHEKVAQETGANIAVAVHPTDLLKVVSIVKNIPVFSQTGDAYTRGADGEAKKTQTGRMTPKMVLKCGGKGILVNHAENPRTNEEIKQIVDDFKGGAGELVVIVCAENSDRGAEITSLCSPDFVAVEPPEMIGGDVSVTTRPEIIVSAVEKIGGNVLVGAGVKTGEDVKSAKELGTKGVLLASGVIKPKTDQTPEEVLRELAEASLS